MAFTTSEEQLALLRATYQDVLEKGQDISVNGRTLRRPPLDVLAREIDRLQAQVRSRTSGPIRAGLRRPSG